MSTKRIIPFLMLHREELFNSVQFQHYTYIGDPLIAVKIFNEKEAQEMCIVDIDPSKYGTEINYGLLADIASECFMPLSYGGGVNSVEAIRKILYSGFEKIILNTALHSDFRLLSKAADEFGSSTIIGCIDFVEQNGECYVHDTSRKISTDVISYSKRLEDNGAGELLLNNITRDGTKKGLNTDLIARIANHVSIPIIASGGVATTADLSAGLAAGANAVAASSLFVYKGNLDAVLINYPDKSIINQIRTLND